MFGYALLDWDNTLHKGFTIVNWMKYLCEKQIIKQKHYDELLEQMKLYGGDKISYGQLNDKVALIYAKSLIGISVPVIKNAAHDFCLRDKDIYSFTRNMVRILKENRIEILIISGSPQMLLLEYSKLLGVDAVYGLIIERKEGYYTGNIKRNYGAEKSKIVQEISATKGIGPIFALGDSEADAPMIKSAKYGCFVNNQTGSITYNNKLIGFTSSIVEVMKNIGLATMKYVENEVILK